jgi:hypothetical protein
MKKLMWGVAGLLLAVQAHAGLGVRGFAGYGLSTSSFGFSDSDIPFALKTGQGFSGGGELLYSKSDATSKDPRLEFGVGVFAPLSGEKTVTGTDTWPYTGSAKRRPLRPT